MSLLYFCASNNIRAYPTQRTPMRMENVFRNELCWLWGFPKGWRNWGQTSHCPWSRTTKKCIPFKTCSTISSIRNQNSFWLYTGPNIGQDKTNIVGLYYMQTMGSQPISHLLGLGMQAHCILTFTFFPSPSPVFTKHKLYCMVGAMVHPMQPPAGTLRDAGPCSSFTGCVGTVYIHCCGWL